MNARRVVCAWIGAATLAACDSGNECTIGTSEGCDEGLVCEAFPGDVPRCATPVVIRGRVFDALDTLGIEGARLVALDANGAARSDVSFSIADGVYELPVSIPRNDEGEPRAEAVTLRVDAAGYQTFPRAPRQALPIDLGAAVRQDDRYVVDNAVSDVALLPSEQLGARISGSVQHEQPGGVLVVAEQGGVAVATSVTGADGRFDLYDVPAGTTTISGYRGGLYASPVTVSVATSAVEGVVLPATSQGLATVSGSVNIVNAEGGLDTSVILVVASTFEMATARGETPSGLRVAGVSNAFAIEGVPPGRYAVLAAFENDFLVRDPDENISGTDIVFIDVAGAAIEIGESFKVTEALAVISPGASGLEVVTAPPVLRWAQDSSEDGYQLRVYDAFGNVVHENLQIPEGRGSEPIAYPLDGVALEPGMIYQFRAWSIGRGSRLSATEDLLGVFQYQP